MYEVIWSVFMDKFVVRPCGEPYGIKPHFVGTKEECFAWADSVNKENGK